jgi:hypothetical protein
MVVLALGDPGVPVTCCAMIGAAPSSSAQPTTCKVLHFDAMRIDGPFRLQYQATLTSIHTKQQFPWRLVLHARDLESRGQQVP